MTCLKWKAALFAALLAAQCPALASCDDGDDDEETDTDSDEPSTGDGGAPYVYLYPEAAQQVTVELVLAPGNEITHAEPPYEGAWSVWAEPDGTIDGCRGFLFYEVEFGWNVQQQVGWSAEATELFDELEEILFERGFDAGEVQDFLDYWTAHMPYAPCYRIFPQDDAIISEQVALDVDPEPDSSLRLWLLISGADECEEIAAPAAAPAFERTGFAVVEWGVVLYNATFQPF